MKLSIILALSGLGLCASPLALAQISSPATTTAAATTTTTTSAPASGVEAKIKQMEDAWAASQTKPDHGASVVEGFLATDYAGVGSKGEIRNKAGQIDHIKTDTDTYTAATNDHMDVHLYGSDVATVCGTSTEKGKDKAGKDFNRTFAWVDTWMQRNGKWECIASGGAPVKKE